MISNEGRMTKFLSFLTLSSAICHLSSAALAAPSHCLSLYDECKYKADFTHFEYVNPDAPKGGAVKLVETGTFDNLNPFILKGVKAPAIGGIFDSLMVASQDEPQTMYGLIASSVDLAEDNSTAEFVLRKEAKFHDDSPITADDVVFSFTTLKEKGDPVYKIMYAPIVKVEKTSEQSVKFTFNDTKNKELPMIVAGMPIFSKAYYAKIDFDKTTLESPLGSGAYKVESVEQGKNITYKRVTNYWAEKLPINIGQYNFDTMRYDMYRDENVTLEALKAGAYDFRREYIARNWATAYNTPAIKDGRLIKREIPDGTPQGMQAFVFNTRSEKFSDRRVREAIGLTLDYEWVNKTIFYGAYVRNKSFFENTEFEASGLPSGKELALLETFASELPPALFKEPFANPVTDGSGNPRDNLLKAKNLLEDAGWLVKDGKRVNAKGKQLSLEVMLRQPTMERVIAPMRRNLERLGIASSIRMVDDAQYQKRTDNSDFDMVSIWINRGIFFPGNEQVSLWHSSQADIKGGNNLAGLKSKAVDAILDSLTKAHDKDSLLAAGRALDRVLLWENVVIPNWHSSSFRVAYWDKFGIPKITPKYSLGFQTWWVKDNK
ncbi:MAG: extracellular solute-binding protein [Rickettsiales bacterium]|jgi:microcin C transport system substrate-binding protein